MPGLDGREWLTIGPVARAGVPDVADRVSENTWRLPRRQTNRLDLLITALTSLADGIGHVSNRRSPHERIRMTARPCTRIDRTPILEANPWGAHDALPPTRPPPTFVAVLAFVTVLTLAACHLAARRTARVDALRLRADTPMWSRRRISSAKSATHLTVASNAALTSDPDATRSKYPWRLHAD
jgi:hypothetical protein